MGPRRSLEWWCGDLQGTSSPCRIFDLLNVFRRVECRRQCNNTTSSGHEIDCLITAHQATAVTAAPQWPPASTVASFMRRTSATATAEPTAYASASPAPRMSAASALACRIYNTHRISLAQFYHVPARPRLAAADGALSLQCSFT